MTTSPEKSYKELSQALKEHKNEIQDRADFEKFVKDFMGSYKENIRGGNPKAVEPETSTDYLELAEEADDIEDSLKYAKKALKLDKNNLDAARIIIDIEAKNTRDTIERYAKLVEQGEKYLKKKHLFDEIIGDFWLAFETRPYMRARFWYMRAMLNNDMYRKAGEECKEMLRLCEGDNLGVRYELMHIYTLLEEQDLADELYKKFNETSTHMTLPYSMLYYRLGDYEKAEKLLKDLASVNKDTKKFFKHICRRGGGGFLEDAILDRNPMGEVYNSIDEFIGEVENYPFVIMYSAPYPAWANEILSRRKRRKK